MIEKPISLILKNRDMSTKAITELLGGEEGRIAHLGDGGYWYNLRVHIADRKGPKFEVTKKGPYLERARRFCEKA